MKKNPYKSSAKKLKQLGLIDYDLRSKLSSAQKGVITKKMQEWGHVVNHPELFHSATVSKHTAGILRQSSRSKEKNVTPFKITKTNRVFIPLNGFETANIRDGQIVFKNKSGIISERVSLVGAHDFLTKLKSLSKKRLASNEFLTVKLGANDSFHRARFKSYADLFKYVNEYFAPHLSLAKRQELMAQMSIVKVTEPIPTAKKKPKHAKKKGNPKTRKP